MHIHAVTSSQKQNFSANWGQILNQQFNQLERKVSRLGGAEERRIFGKAKQIISSINGNIDCKNTTKNGMNFRTYFLQKPDNTIVDLLDIEANNSETMSIKVLHQIAEQIKKFL